MLPAGDKLWVQSQLLKRTNPYVRVGGVLRAVFLIGPHWPALQRSDTPPITMFQLIARFHEGHPSSVAYRFHLRI